MPASLKPHPSSNKRVHARMNIVLDSITMNMKNKALVLICSRLPSPEAGPLALGKRPRATPFGCDPPKSAPLLAALLAFVVVVIVLGGGGGGGGVTIHPAHTPIHRGRKRPRGPPRPFPHPTLLCPPPATTARKCARSTRSAAPGAPCPTALLPTRRPRRRTASCAFGAPPPRSVATRPIRPRRRCS